MHRILAWGDHPHRALAIVTVWGMLVYPVLMGQRDQVLQAHVEALGRHPGHVEDRRDPGRGRGRHLEAQVRAGEAQGVEAILGRTAAYRGREYDWDEMIRESETLEL